jgi:hypothetical protein
MTPIRGARYKCAVCPNVNLCTDCEEWETDEWNEDVTVVKAHENTHALLKIKSAQTDLSTLKISETNSNTDNSAPAPPKI